MDKPLGSFLQGLRDALPVALTFFFIFIAVGTASQAAGLDLAQGMALTALVFAAPAQFAAIDLIANQVWLPAIAAIAVINFRFLLMAVSLSPYLGRPPRLALLFALQMLSASTFATTFSRLRAERVQHPFAFFLGVCLGSFPIAVAATGVGYAFHGHSSPLLNDLLAVLMPVYFSTFLAKAWPRARFLLAGLLGFCFTPVFNALAPGLGLVLAALLVAAVLLIMEPRPCPTI